MAVFRSTMMVVLFLSVSLHISLLFGVISVESESYSTAITLHESDSNDGDDDDDGIVETVELADTEVFQPTKEWQTIKEGQSIPAGLHVRINLSTGEKEAKLLDETEEETDQISQDEDKTENLEKEELERRLVNIEGDDCQDCTSKTDNEALIEEVKKRYRSIEELKKEFAELDVKMETDIEIMKKLVTQYQASTSVTQKVSLLEDLEYYVHQVDNAVDLKSLGGWDLISEALNSTEELLQSEAAHVLGSAVQSNPKAQVIAFDGGALYSLLHLLVQSPSPTVQKRALYGLSSLIRFFPYAQQKFIELGGVSVLTAAMKNSESSRLAIKIKSMTLLHDLLVEQKNVLSDESIFSEQSKEKRSQYEKIMLAPHMVEQGWCEFVPAMLDVSDHDTTEKVLNSLNMLSGHCRYTDNVDLHKRLSSLRAEYEALSEEELSVGDGGSYFTEILQLVEQILQNIS